MAISPAGSFEYPTNTAASAATNTNNLIAVAQAGTGAAHPYLVQPAEMAALSYMASASHPLASPIEFKVTQFFLQVHYGQTLDTFDPGPATPSHDMRVIRDMAVAWREILNHKMGLAGTQPRRGRPPLFQGD